MTEANDLFEAVTVRCQTAREFLGQLDEVHERWRDGIWVFRGQNDESWKLLPSLFRLRTIDSDPSYELDAIGNFLHFINLAKLPIPANALGYSTHMKDALFSSTDVLITEGMEQPGLRYDFSHVVFAIAQHSGIPTRLLDFTYNPLIAAYFAAEISELQQTLGYSDKSMRRSFCSILDAHKEDPDTALSLLDSYGERIERISEHLPKYISVWAVRTRDLIESTSLRLLEHPYSEITNLNSQMGVFITDTQHTDFSDDPGEMFYEEVKKLVTSAGIWRLSLPFSERSDLLSLLKRKRVSSMYLKPSYESVAQAVLTLLANRNKGKHETHLHSDQ